MALSLIFLLYATIAGLAGAGAIALSSRRLTLRAEPVAYGVLLAPIALYYLVFQAQLSSTGAGTPELLPALGFAALGLAGTRLTPLLVLGYVGHGAWDLWHEVLMHLGQLGGFTPIPLAYGVFCAGFDWVVAGYCWTRRHAWAAAWRAA